MINTAINIFINSDRIYERDCCVEIGSSKKEKADKNCDIQGVALLNTIRNDYICYNTFVRTCQQQLSNLREWIQKRETIR